MKIPITSETHTPVKERAPLYTPTPYTDPTHPYSASQSMLTQVLG